MRRGSEQHRRQRRPAPNGPIMSAPSFASLAMFLPAPPRPGSGGRPARRPGSSATPSCRRRSALRPSASTGAFKNRAHYVRDVTFAEDASRIRCNPGIFASLRSFAANILRFNQRQQRRRCALPHRLRWDRRYPRLARHVLSVEQPWALHEGTILGRPVAVTIGGIELCLGYPARRVRCMRMEWTNCTSAH
jgi:hypothetical protein